MATYQVPVISQFVWQPTVKDKDLTAPPGGESKGDRYIVGAGATGAWSGQDGNIAQYNGSGWDFIAKKEGMMTYVEDEDVFYLYTTSWSEFSAGGAPSPRTSEKKTDNYVVDGDDGGKTIEMTAGAEKTFTLPACGTVGKGFWIKFVKGDASKLNIDPDGTDVIADGGAGDPIYNNESGEAGYADITLEVDFDEGVWLIVAAHGTWITTD